MKNRLRRRDALPLIGALLAAQRGEGRAASPELFEDWVRATPAERKQALAASLERIQRLDDSIHAWVQVLPQPQIADGPLAGIPFGAKDIMETRALVTEYGSPIYKGRHGTEDAAMIRRLESLGAILLGKTHTAQFAHRSPAPTRNPRNLEHTPGGSSSGSAAAVAAGMVPFALGTQTAGSILRPASYCGITGFKPTFGTLPLDGVLPFSRSLDTLGLFTNTPSGMLALWEALGQAVGRDEERLVLGNIRAEEYAAHRRLLHDAPARRAAHFFSETERVRQDVAAWKEGDLGAFGALMTASGANGVTATGTGLGYGILSGIGLAVAIISLGLPGRAAVRKSSTESSAVV